MTAVQQLLHQAEESRIAVENNSKRAVAKIMELSTRNELLQRDNEIMQASQERLFHSGFNARHSPEHDIHSPKDDAGRNDEVVALTSQCQTLMELVKELTMVNHKLKEEQVQVKEMLANTRDELVEATKNEETTHSTSNHTRTVHDELMKSTSSSPIQDRIMSSPPRVSLQSPIMTQNSSESTAGTVIHDDGIIEESALQTYIKTLTTLATQLHSRIKSADPIQLNRRLRRAFDMKEITNLSNNIVDSIVGDIQRLSLRFPTLQNRGGGNGEAQDDENDVLVLQGLLGLVQSLLEAVASSRTTLNEYALSYVERMVCF